VKGHYLLVVVGEGKGSFEREYFELESEDETAEEALTRWILQHPDMRDRKRNRYRMERAIRESVEYVKLTHPTGWHAARREAGLDIITTKGARRGR